MIKIKIKCVKHTVAVLQVKQQQQQFRESYLLFMLKYHYSASFIPSGKQFSRIVELNRWNDVS